MRFPTFRLWGMGLALGCMMLIAGCVSDRGYRQQDPWHTDIPAQGAPSPLAGTGANAPATPYADVFGDTLTHPLNADIPRNAPATAAAPLPVRIGLLVPSSGKNAALGQAMLKSAQLAVFDLGYPGFELVPRDTGDSPETAARAAREALAAGAQLLIGPLTAPAARAIQPAARAANVNMFTFSTDWTLAGPNTYVMGFLPFSQVRRIAAFAAESGLRSIAVIAPQNEYGDAVVSAFSSQAPAFGLRQAGTARVPASGGGIGDIIQSLAARSATSPFDAVLIAAAGTRAQEISDALTAAGLGPDRIARLGTGLWDDAMTAANGHLDGAAFAAPSPQARATFERKYAGLYGVNPPRLSTLAYDATALAIALARSGGTGGERFPRNEILNPNGFAGIDGIFRFRNDGLIERGDAVLRFHNRAVLEASPAPDSFQMRGY